MTQASTHALPARPFLVKMEQGRGEALALGEVLPGAGDSVLHWIHLPRQDTHAAERLSQAGLDHLVREALLATETRPRFLAVGKGLLVVLRGVNLNEGEEPEDMVSLRLWLEAGRVISVQGRPMLALGDVLKQAEQGRGPQDAGTFLALVLRHILNRLDPVLDELTETGDGLEDEVLNRPMPGLRRRVGMHRRQCIQLRRHLAPMRELATALSLEDHELLGVSVRRHLHESSDRLIRLVEDLDALRERALVTHDELAAGLGDRINTTMFRLSLIAAVFLPLSLLTSLLGINVAGIPFAERGWAFGAVCLLLVLAGGLGALVVKRRYWSRGKA